MANSNVWNIPSGSYFAGEFVKGLHQRFSDISQDDFSKIVIFVPTRRLAGGIIKEFQAISSSGGCLLPQIYTLGDLSFSHIPCLESLDLSLIEPAIDSTERIFLLSKLLSKLEGSLPFSSPGGLSLGSSLAGIMDEVYDSGLDLKCMLDIDTDVAPSEHNQISLRFLKDIFSLWPDLLREINQDDIRNHRRKIINALIDFWSINPPEYPVIIAGSTGSVATTSDLISVVASFKNGYIVLPGVCNFCENFSWGSVVPNHPQYFIKSLIEQVKFDRKDVVGWVNNDIEQDYLDKRRYLTSIIMMNDTDRWHEINKKSLISEASIALKNVTLVEADNIYEEALAIAVAIRKALEEPEKTISFVTSNYQLVQLVSQEMTRWNIKTDNVFGQLLTHNACGIFFLLVTRVLLFASLEDFLDLIKSNLFFAGFTEKENNTHRALFEKIIREKTDSYLPKTLKDVHEMITEKPKDFPGGVRDWFLTIFRNFDGEDISYPCKVGFILEKLLRLSGLLSNDGLKCRLWEKDTYENSGKLQSIIQRLPALLEAYEVSSEKECFEFIYAIFSGENLHTSQDDGLRVKITSFMDFRTEKSDVVILGGLNEGVFPAHVDHNQWIGEKIRNAIGLRLKDHYVGLAAHDFSHCFCSGDEVILTCSRYISGRYVMPSRWLSSIRTLLNGLDGMSHGMSHGMPHSLVRQLYIKGDDLISLARGIREIGRNVVETERPYPKPPLHARPKKISATAISKLICDPYSVYAREVLSLKALPTLFSDNNTARIRGYVIHKLFEYYHKQVLLLGRENCQNIYDKAYANLLLRYHSYLEKIQLWSLKFKSMWDWFCALDKDNLSDIGELVGAEISGEITFKGTKNCPLNNAMILHARADRIDKRFAGGYAIYDMKTGMRDISDNSIMEYDKQLLLEAFIARSGGFEDIPPLAVEELTYIYVRGINNRDKYHPINEKHICDLDNFVENLGKLLSQYENEDLGYLSHARMPRDFSTGEEFEHLARSDYWLDKMT